MYSGLRRLSALIVLMTLATIGLSGCGDGNSESATQAGVKSGALSAVLASSDLATGKQRLTFVVLDGDVPVTGKPTYARFFKNVESNQAQLVGEGAIPWVPLGANESSHSGAAHDQTELTGIYYATVEFDEAGQWGIGITLGDKLDEATEMRLQFAVKSKNQAVAVGERAVSVQNPTAKDRPLKQIHTGADPDPEFHSMNIADAISSGKPSVIVFATPSFCRTRTCGPSLQVAQRAATKYGPRANFVHVEPYELDADGDLANDAQGNPFKLVPAGLAWRLPTEPWVFVVDKSGTVVARFDGPYALEELEHVLGQVAGSGG